jgi:hypothetical protein
MHAFCEADWYWRELDVLVVSYLPELRASTSIPHASSNHSGM